MALGQGLSRRGTDGRTLRRTAGLRGAGLRPSAEGLRVAAASCLLPPDSSAVTEPAEVLAFRVPEPSGALVPEWRNESETETTRRSFRGNPEIRKGEGRRERKSPGSEGQMRSRA